jgi:hypothetical chaperone protein
MYIGLDFGTTNSGAAVFDGERVHVLPLDPANQDPTVLRSTLYIARDHQVSIGREAVDAYYQQNIGRPSRMVRQYVGEIEMTFAEIGTFVKDVYVLVDKLTPGRLLRSLKGGLATGYEGTTIFGRYYELEELIALYLREVRQRVEETTGQAVEGVVLGRPVHFAGGNSEADDQRAEDRLRRAASMAGFRQVAFELEPVAAALHYELHSEPVRRGGRPQNVVIFDFGGGTLDITVMRIGSTSAGARANSFARKVFATGGVGIAGDVFDRRIIQELLLEHFGRGTTVRMDLGSSCERMRSPTERQGATKETRFLPETGFLGRKVPFPDPYTDALVNWQTVLELNRPDTLHFFELAQIGGSHPARVRALESLVINNAAIRLFDEIERAKIAISDAHFAVIRLTDEDIHLWQPLTRSQFESLIAGETQRIEACLLDTLSRSGLQMDEIDAVVRTGGSAQIPCFIQMLERIFGPQKVTLSDVFSSVTSGLAIRACRGNS